jgi:SAM-dependent methyltransferase
MTGWEMGGRTYPYLPQRRWNERDIELPWAVSILAAAKGRVLELGNATQHTTQQPARTIVDRWDRAFGPMPVERVDIVDFEGGPYDLILSVSTLEHVGTDKEEQLDRGKAARAFDHCVSLLAPGGRFAFTIPCGYHPELQAHVLEYPGLDLRVMGRKDLFSTRWTEMPVEAAVGCDFPWEWESARRVIFGRYTKP